MSAEGNSSCCPSGTCTTSVCRVCGNPGMSVTKVTVESLVREARRSLLKSPEGFSFCRTPDCAVVYFNNDSGEYIEKDDMKVRVGIKEKQGPAPLCYCFGWTKKKIEDEISRTGKCRAVEDILNRMKSTGCDCEHSNPSGGCCLKDVADYVAIAHEHGKNG